MIDYRRINSSWLEREVGPAARARGKGYFRQGRASVEEVKPLGAHRLRIQGTCKGTVPKPYHQRVDIVDDDGDLELVGDCSCPVGFNCKHVVALVLTWLLDARRAGPKSDPVSEWLSALDPTDEPEHKSVESLLYVLAPRDPPEPAFVLELVVSRRLRDGSWGRGRTTYLSSLNDHNYRGSYLRSEDFEIVRFLEVCNRHTWRASAQIADAAGSIALDRMLATDRLLLGPDRLGPMVAGGKRPLVVRWVETATGFRPALEVNGGAQVLVDVSPPRYVDPARLEIGPLSLPEGLEADQLRWLSRAPAIDPERIEEVSRRLMLSAPTVPRPAPVDVVDVSRPPRPCLAVRFDPSAPEGSGATLSFSYEDLRIEPSDPRDTVVAETGDALLRVRRDHDAEARAQDRLLAAGLVGKAAGHFVVAGDDIGRRLRDSWFAWWEREAPRLEAEGWTVTRIESPHFALARAGEITGAVDDSAGDWFSLRFDLEVDGERLPLLPMVAELIEHYRLDRLPATVYLEADDGRFVGLSTEQLEPVVATIVELYDRAAGDAIRLARPDATRLIDLEGLPIRGATSLQRLARKLADFSGLRTVPLPSTFKGSLRPYQQQGLDWLQFLREHGFNGILADDMGLGKTIQTLAHLAVERRAGRMKQPSLIVAPTSLMGNWRREAEQFTPKLRVLVLHGPDRAAWFERLSEFDVVLTTYPLLPRDRAQLLAQRWHYLILDEAQQVKNPRAQAAQVVRKLDCAHRLCLTGTPMENHLGELWAQFDFLMPGFLGDLKTFTRTYRTPIEKQGDVVKLESLTRRTRPFLLRRKKEEVASELPPKTEMLRTATLGTGQARLYEGIRLTMEQRVRSAIASRGLARSHIIVLEALLKLRQVCCDPRLLPAGTTGVRGAGSAKFELLFDLLPELLEEGRRVLLFSQFTTMLGLIETEVARRGMSYCKLTGQTRKRDEAIDRFRSGEVDLFLISLKAGGVGLNLVEADTVIHYDPWWNPAVEHQATDRAHRIGQQRPVFIYRLVTEGTVEEKILALQARKQALADATYGKARRRDEPPIDEKTIQALLGAID